MNSNRTPRSSLQAANARPRNSGPLSRTMASGSPLSAATRSSTRRTRNPPREVSTSIEGALARAIVHHGQHTNHFSRTHAITHEIDRPPLIRPRRCRAGSRSVPADSPPLSDAHDQSFLPIEPVHALVVYLNPFPHQHRGQPAVAEAHALGRQVLQPLPQLCVAAGSPPAIAIRRSCQIHQPAGVPFAHGVLPHDITRGCPKSHRLYQFFERTSFRVRLSNVSSATTWFSLRFSSSKCFSFLASPLSIPPYFAFQR